MVTLAAAADAGSSFAGWSGLCSGTGGCTVTMDADKAVTATFEQPQIPSPPEPPAAYPLGTANPADGGVAEVAAGVSGNGSVEQSSGRTASSSAASPIGCGFNEFRCYTRVKPGQTIVLRARPRPGYAFKGWTGCPDVQGTTCHVVAGRLQTVTARFEHA